VRAAAGQEARAPAVAIAVSGYKKEHIRGAARREVSGRRQDPTPRILGRALRLAWHGQGGPAGLGQGARARYDAAGHR